MEGGAVQTRLNLALDELRRAQTLASVGEYADARALLRKGSLEKVRTDLRTVASYLRVQRPTFAQFEGLAVTGSLDAFDNAMRAVQQGVPEVTRRDVDVNARAAVAALEEVLPAGQGRDVRADEAKTGGGRINMENAARRDFSLRNTALADARIGAGDDASYYVLWCITFVRSELTVRDSILDCCLRVHRRFSPKIRYPITRRLSNVYFDARRAAFFGVVAAHQRHRVEDDVRDGLSATGFVGETRRHDRS